MLSKTNIFTFCLGRKGEIGEDGYEVRNLEFT